MKESHNNTAPASSPIECVSPDAVLNPDNSIAWKKRTPLLYRTTYRGEETWAIPITDFEHAVRDLAVEKYHRFMGKLGL